MIAGMREHHNVAQTAKSVSPRVLYSLQRRQRREERFAYGVTFNQSDKQASATSIESEGPLKSERLRGANSNNMNWSS